MDRNDFPVVPVELTTLVALRKESVDRNTQRRDFKALGLPVALRKESVDRNSIALVSFKARISRSPQGERG